MPKYLLRGAYSVEGNKGILKGGGGTARRESINAMVESEGGKLECFYWALGKDDFYIILDVPDMATIAAVSMKVGSSGAVSRLSSTPLLTAEDVDAACKRDVKYTPPGQ